MFCHNYRPFGGFARLLEGLNSFFNYNHFGGFTKLLEGFQALYSTYEAFRGLELVFQLQAF